MDYMENIGGILLCSNVSSNGKTSWRGSKFEIRSTTECFALWNCFLSAKRRSSSLEQAGNDDTEDHKLDDLEGCDVVVSLPAWWIVAGEDDLDEESDDV